MQTDPRRMVAEGYDIAAAEYAQWLATSVADIARGKYLEAFSERLPAGARVLELGCGGGGSTTEHLAQRFALTGVDISASQIALASERLPMATFLHADMTRATFEPSSFDGVAAFYSLIHLPYGELPGMLARIATWLRDGGVLVACFGARAGGEHVEADWLGGAPMYWSGYPPEDTLRFIEDAGLAVVTARVETNIEDEEASPFLWVIAEQRRIQTDAPSSAGPPSP